MSHIFRYFFAMKQRKLVEIAKIVAIPIPVITHTLSIHLFLSYFLYHTQFVTQTGEHAAIAGATNYAYLKFTNCAISEGVSYFIYLF